MDDISDIRAYYDRFPEEEERLDSHQLEWDVTWHYLERYLPPEGPILEVGAATGRYTRELARRGYRVTAVDLSPALTAIAADKCRAAGVSHRVEHVVADARDLGCLRGRTFAAALVMGPLYHLIEEADRRAVLRQVHGLLGPGGIVVSAFISRLGIWADQVVHFASYIVDHPGDFESMLARGRGQDTAHDGEFRGYYAHPDEVAPLHEAEGFATLVVAAAEPGIGSGDEESYNRLEGEQRRIWLSFLAGISAEPSLVGASRHLLYVGKRTDAAPARG
jgi:S-adenosylmethionine-dependent methyltransferase